MPDRPPRSPSLFDPLTPERLAEDLARRAAAEVEIARREAALADAEARLERTKAELAEMQAELGRLDDGGEPA